MHKTWDFGVFCQRLVSMKRKSLRVKWKKNLVRLLQTKSGHQSGNVAQTHAVHAGTRIFPCPRSPQPTGPLGPAVFIKSRGQSTVGFKSPHRSCLELSAFNNLERMCVWRWDPPIYLDPARWCQIALWRVWMRHAVKVRDHTSANPSHMFTSYLTEFSGAWVRRLGYIFTTTNNIFNAFARLLDIRHAHRLRVIQYKKSISAVHHIIRLSGSCN